jgi:hypothetical protein
MYLKSKLTFSTKHVFGNKFRATESYSFLILSKMLFNNKINVDGTINIEQIVNFTIHELWEYIYYLFHYNSTTIDEFDISEIDKSEKFMETANAENFYSYVKSCNDGMPYNLRKDASAVRGQIEPLSLNQLIYFINFIIHKYGDDLVIPVIDYLKVLLKKDVTSKLKGIKIHTGLKDGNVRIVTDPKEVNNANIKVLIYPEMKTI